MKWLLLLSFMVLTKLCPAQQQGKIITSTKVYSEDGKLQMLIHYNPGCSCRTYTEYYSDGSLFATRRFKLEGNKEYIDGEDISYYPDGQIKQYKLWKNAIPAGKAYELYSNGKVKKEEWYDNKFKSGTWRTFDEKGNLIKEQIYVPGKTAWNSKKEFVTINYYSDGKKVHSEVYEAGKKVKSTEVVSKPAITQEDGKSLFMLRCASCHSADKDGYGPALKGVVKRRSQRWLYSMIEDGMKLVESGDKTAVTLYEKWAKRKHPVNTRLSSAQIEAIIRYLRTMK